MNGDFLPVAALALASMAAAVILKEIRREYAVLLSLISSVLLMLWGTAALLPIIDTVKRLLALTGKDDSCFELLLKALGVSLCARFAADSCKDAGEGAIASKVGFCGRVCLTALSIPLLEELLATAEKILSW